MRFYNPSFVQYFYVLRTSDSFNSNAWCILTFCTITERQRKITYSRRVEERGRTGEGRDTFICL